MYEKVKGIGERIPIKLIATVLVAILIPSVLVTSLGLVTVFQADGFVKEFVRDTWREELVQVRDAVEPEWSSRLAELHEITSEAVDRGADLARLRDRPEVLDVFVTDAGELHSLPARAEGRILRGDLDDPRLQRARQIERDEALPDALPAALAAYLEIVDTSREPSLRVEALFGALRCTLATGQARGALRLLERCLLEFGSTRDETGVSRRLPLLLMKIELHAEGDAEHAPVRVPAQAIADLVRALHVERHRLDPATIEFYEDAIKAHLPPGAEAPEPDLPRQDRLSPQALELARPVFRASARRARSRGRPQAAVIERNPQRDGTLATAEASGNGPVSPVWTHQVGDQDVFVHLVLDERAFVRDLARVSRELSIDLDRITVRGLQESVSLSGRRVESPEELPVAMALPAPLSRLDVGWVPPPGSEHIGFRSFEVLTLATFSWAVILLVLTIVVGVFYTLRYVLRETRTARLKSDFVGFLSHELKTPLAAIRMFTETLLSGRIETPEDRDECLQLIDKESDRLTRLIDTVLEYSRVETRQKRFRFASCSMDDVVAEAVHLFHGHTQGRPRQVETRSVQRISKIQMDRASMVELMLNLLSNADKYSPPKERIVINLRETVDEISVDVVDRGVGIPKRDHKKIFDKFFRSNDYLSRAVEGTGLGLAFARYVAKVHNGEIRVTSVRNAGSTFTLSLKKTHVLAE